MPEFFVVIVFWQFFYLTLYLFVRYPGESNQLRLWLSSFAYVLMQSLRQYGLVGTELANAQLGTIRLKRLKAGAQIRLSVRRVVIAFSRAWVGQSLFHQVYQRLQQLPQPG